MVTDHLKHRIRKHFHAGTADVNTLAFGFKLSTERVQEIIDEDSEMSYDNQKIRRSQFGRRRNLRRKS